MSCNKSFGQPPCVSNKRWLARKFCSLKCRIEWRLKNEWKSSKCLFCGKEFRHYRYLKRNYCSISCHSKMDRGGKIELTCKKCGRKFTPKRRGKQGRNTKYCSDKCRGLMERNSNHWNWKGGVNRKNHRRETKEYKEWRLSVYRRDYFTCQDCKKHCNQKNIVAHHLKG